MTIIAGEIKGIKVELEGDTTGLSSALKSLNGTVRGTQNELKQVERLLKLDPGNVELLAQKEKLLGSGIEQNKQKVEALRAAKEQADRDMQNGTEINEKQYRQLEREIANAEISIKQMNDAAEDTGGAEGVKKLGDEFEKTGNKAEKVKTALATVGKATAAVIGAAVTAAAAAGTAIYSVVSKTAEAGDAIDKGSQKMGVSAESYQKLSLVAEHCGTSIDAFARAQAKLNTKGDTRSIDDVILALSQIPDEAERSRQATELFGAKIAMELAPTLNSGTDGIKGMYEEAEKYRMLMSDDAVKASAAFEDSLTTLNGAVGGLKNRIAGEFLPSITSMTDGLALLVSGDMSGLDNIGQGINDFITNASEAASKITEVAVPIISSLSTAIIQNIPVLVSAATAIIMQLIQYIIAELPNLVSVAGDILTTLCEGITGALPTLIPAATEAVLTIVENLLNNIDGLINAGLELIMGLAQGLINAIPTLISHIPQIVTAIVNAIVNNLPLILAAGVQLIVMLAQGIITSIPQIVAAIPQIISALVSGFASAASQMLTIGKNLVEGIWNGISGAAGWLMDKIKGFAKNVVDGVKGFFGIKSPSRVMRDEVGKMIAEGMAVGIIDNEYKVDDAVKQLFENLELQRKLDLINDSEYYDEMWRLRDDYIKRGTKEWWDYTQKIIDYQDKAAEEAKKSISEAKKAISDLAKTNSDIYQLGYDIWEKQNPEATAIEKNLKQTELYCNQLKEQDILIQQATEDYNEALSTYGAESLEARNAEKALMTEQKARETLLDTLQKTIDAKAELDRYGGYTKEEYIADRKAEIEYRNILINDADYYDKLGFNMTYRDADARARSEYKGIKETTGADTALTAMEVYQKYLSGAEGMNDIFAEKAADEMSEIPETFSTTGENAAEAFGAGFLSAFGSVADKIAESVNNMIDSVNGAELAVAGGYSGGVTKTNHITVKQSFSSSSGTGKMSAWATKNSTEKLFKKIGETLW